LIIESAQRRRSLRILLVASGTNIETSTETLLPLSRGYGAILLQRKTRRNAPRFFHDASF
jgi:hypothetical protein